MDIVGQQATKILISLLAACLLVFVSCDNEPADVKEVIRQLALQHIQYYIDGDAHNHVAGYAEGVIDLGGGQNGDGSWDLEAWEAELEWYFGTSYYEEKWGGKTLEDCFIMDEILVYDYEEIMADENLQAERYGFTVQPGDYLIIMPPCEGSPAHDGFCAFYRVVGSEWKIVAAGG